MDITGFSTGFFSLAGRSAVVTGGNTGLGRAFSLALATAGADIYVPGATADDGSTARLVQDAGRRMEFLECDLTGDGVPRQVVDGCADAFGSVDILVNCAGICRTAPAEEFGRAEWDPMLDVNLTVPFDLTREAVRHMVPRGSGKIINVASLFSFLGGQWSPAYAATKHAVAGLTKAYCDELAQHNIQVNAVAPGYFATAITERTRSDPAAAQRVLDHIPAGRWGEPADLMGTAVFLASRASDYVNGHVLPVDGGYLVR